MDRIEKFMRDAKMNYDIKFIGKTINPRWQDNELRNYYKVTISTPKGSVEVPFWDSVYNTEHNRKPIIDDILYCLQVDFGWMTFKNFCDEYGCDKDSITAYQLYAECMSQYIELSAIFTPGQMEELGEIQMEM